MEGLKETVRSLVALVLAAGALEMVVPQGNLRGYVRVVMGLLVMLTVLNPMFAWIKTPLAVDPEALSAPASGRLPSLAEITADSGRLRAVDAAATVREFRRNIMRSAEELARQVPGVRAAEAEVNTGTVPAGGGTPPITLVRVYVVPGVPAADAPPAPGSGGSATDGSAAGGATANGSGGADAPGTAGGQSEVTPVRAVRPVAAQRSRAEAAAGAAPAAAPDPREAELVAAVRRRVVEGLALPADRVLVTIKRH